MASPFKEILSELGLSGGVPVGAATVETSTATDGTTIDQVQIDGEVLPICNVPCV